MKGVLTRVYILFLHKKCMLVYYFKSNSDVAFTLSFELHNVPNTPLKQAKPTTTA